ncbi:MAG: SigE family RNA polymerase sigma factor [Arachnia sp.]
MSTDDEFDRFVRASFVALCRTGYLMCGDRQRAEDAAQEALLRTHRRWRRVTDPLAYARRAVATILIDQSRRPWRREIPTERSHDGSVADGSGALGERDEVLRALARLSPRQRGCVVLRYYQDLSVAETAETLGVSEGTVKRATSDALATLRTLLPHPIGEESTP